MSALKQILLDPDVDMEYNLDLLEEVHMSKADLKQFGQGSASAANDCGRMMAEANYSLCSASES